MGYPAQAENPPFSPEKAGFFHGGLLAVRPNSLTTSLITGSRFGFSLSRKRGSLRYGLPLATSRTGPGGLALRNTKSSMETVYSSFPGV